MRITVKDLRAIIACLNNATNSPQHSWIREGNHVKAGIGCWHLSHTDGKYALHRLVEGGIYDYFGSIPARDLYNRIYAMLVGIAAKDNTVKSATGLIVQAMLDAQRRGE